jgi:two-component system, cell cycle response regulator
MKVLVLAGDAKERSLIQTALEKSGHEMVSADNIEQAVKSIESGQIRFVIIDEEGIGFKKHDLLQRMDDDNKPSLYFLTLASADKEAADSDDTLLKPFTVSELKARIVIGRRFQSLGDNLSQAREQIDNMAMYDSLTGLMNRNAFYRIAEGELERARRAASSLSVIALDLDNFKSLNETYGIEAGDEVLKVVAQTVREKSRPYDCIGRWMGDEFIIALPSVLGDDAEKIAERIIKGIRSTQITSKDKILNIGVSAGIAAAQRISASTEIDPLIQQARQAMARAKESGGNQVNVFYV